MPTIDGQSYEPPYMAEWRLEVKALRARNDELRAEVERLTWEQRKTEADLVVVREQRDKAEAEVERLKAQEVDQIWHCTGAAESQIDNLKALLERERAEVERLRDYAREQEEGWRQATCEVERLQLVVLAIENYRQAAAEAGHPMLPWAALDVALDAVRQT